MSDHISSVSKSCFRSIRDLRRIRNTLDTAHIIATNHKYTQHSITATRFFWTFSGLNLIVFSSFTTFPLEQSPNLPNYVTSRLFSSFSSGSKFNSISNDTSGLYQLFSLDNFLISTNFSMFDLTVQLAPLPSSRCNVLQIAHVSKWLTGLSYPPCSCILHSL